MVRPSRQFRRSGPLDPFVLDPVRLEPLALDPVWLDFADRLPLGSAPCPDRLSRSGTNPPTTAT